jgi:polyhydroxyalkanoate synthesis regulator phasin
MDVEKLKKMNELSKELKKHGMADSTRDAFEQAGQMVRDEAVGDVISRSDKKPEQGSSFDRKYQIMLERQNRQIAQEVQALKQTVTELKEAVEQLKKAPKPTPDPRPEPKPPGPPTVQSKLKKEEHPKQGGFTSEDVSVEKVFYFGKK